MQEIEETSLYKTIIDDTNIYNAIYSLESYVFEKGLLSNDDLNLYNQLSDKYNKELINKVIGSCKDKLITILGSEELFIVKPYFRMKDYKDKKINFRPIHTTDLISQICIVCLLNPIMFKDDDSRHFSDITKLIPSNFYGNIPSSNVDNLFVNWKVKYKQYSEAIIKKYNEIKDTKEYSHEICLDLKDFFPSINPLFIYNYIYQKLSTIYCKEEQECLKIVLTKLLYFNVDKEGLDSWVKVYYPENDFSDSEFKVCRGIPQGLPQAYYFANLCMIEIAKIVANEFSGDAYYYVDDSVIYSNACDTKTKFDEKIELINKEIEKTCEKYKNEKPILNNDISSVFNSIKYKILFHTEGKSTFTSIDDAYENLIGLLNLSRQISIAAIFNDTLDDIEDNIVRDKLEVLINAISSEIEKYKQNNPQDNKAVNYNLKLLKRYRRFFLYRLRLLKIREDGEISDEYLKDYYNRYQIDEKDINLEKLFDVMSEDIFIAESRLLLSNIDGRKNELKEKIEDFEYFVVSKELELSEDAKNNLFFKKDIKGTLKTLEFHNQEYTSLSVLASNIFGTYSYSIDIKKKKELFNILKNSTLGELYKGYFKFIYNLSNEFKRKLYNAIISHLFSVTLSNDLSIYKWNNRPLQYYELRILIYVRNRHFNAKLFEEFVLKILDENHEDKGINKIDTLLFDVIHIFIKRIKTPKLIDDLILTHRLVNGLWKNGSKFLNSYTLHNEEHAVDLIKNSVKLVRAVDYLSIKELDYYILFLACYLHDISMVIHPNLAIFTGTSTKSDIITTNFLFEIKKLLSHTTIDSITKKIVLNNFKSVFNFFESHVRDNHTKLSASFIKGRHDSYLKFIEDCTLQIVAEVSESHGYNASEVYGRKSKAKQDLYSVKYMMILLRLADVLDMTKDRISYYILKENINQMEVVSQFHWISHLITDQCNIKVGYKQKDLDYTKVSYLKDGSIEEKLVIEIILNTANVSKINNNNGCKGFDATLEDNSIRVDILDENTICKNSENCIFLCKWITNKHYYLFLELFELKKYLKQVNNSLFHTQIHVDIKFSNSLPLDAEFFDIIKSYIEEK